MTSLSGFGSLAAIPEEKITDKITRRVLAGQKGMMWWKIGAGTHVAAHSHPHEQLVWVVKGRMDFRIDKERRALEAGGIATILGGVEHEGYCHEDTEVIAGVFNTTVKPAAVFRAQKRTARQCVTERDSVHPPYWIALS